MLDFINDVPPLLRLILAVAIFVGISLVLVRVFHDRAIGLAQEPSGESSADSAEASEEGTQARPTKQRKIPEAYNLTGRVITLSTTAFVFMLAFGFSQFWAQNKDAQEAVVNEFVGYSKASLYVDQLPDSPGRKIMEQALADYLANYEEQWPLMRQGDQAAVVQLQGEANRALVTHTVEASATGLGENALWSSITSALDDMSMAAVDRISALPSRASQSVVMLIFVLGLANLVLVAVYQPVRRPINLVAIGLFAGLTAILLFVLVEVSNPYAGGAAVMPLLGS